MNKDEVLKSEVEGVGDEGVGDEGAGEDGAGEEGAECANTGDDRAVLVFGGVVASGEELGIAEVQELGEEGAE